MAYELLSQSRRLNKRGVLIRAGRLENFLKKNKRGSLTTEPRVSSTQWKPEKNIGGMPRMKFIVPKL